MLRFIPLPPGLPEFVLLALLVGLVVFVVRRVGRRRKFARVEADAPLPALATDLRLRGMVRRLYRDPNQGVWLLDFTLGRRRFTFCVTDYAAAQAAYTKAMGREANFAIYGLATLAPGGAEAIRDQITDADSIDLSTDPVRLISGGEFANDYVVIGRVLSSRPDSMDEMPLTVYRVQVVRTDDLTLVLELATPQSNSDTFPDNSMVHGSARLYGQIV